MKDYVRKPLFGREGAGVTVFRNWVAEEGDGEEAKSKSDTEKVVFQKLASLAVDGAKTAVIGSWLIDGEPSGMGIRESSGMITTNTSRFVPHLFR
jgi:glutathionylspermidine synthase